MSRRPRPSVPGRMLHVDSVATHVVCEGSGPVCVLLAGLGGCHVDFAGVAALLAPHRTVVRLDRPGLGLSAPAGGPPTLAGEADRVAHVLDALALPGPATVVGHSLGGLHAEAYARRHPARTGGLVLLDASQAEPCGPPLVPAAVNGAGTRLLAAGLAATGAPRALGPAVRRLAVRAETVRGRDAAPAAEVARGYRTSRVLHAAAQEWTTYPRHRADLTALRARRALPAGMPAPVVVLAAYDARERPAGLRGLREQRRLAALLAREAPVTFRVVAPAGHLLMLDEPAAVAAAVLGEH